MIQLVAYFRDIPLRDHHGNIVIADIRDLRVGQISGKLALIQSEYGLIVFHGHEHSNALAFVIESRNRKRILLVLIFLI